MAQISAGSAQGARGRLASVDVLATRRDYEIRNAKVDKPRCGVARSEAAKLPNTPLQYGQMDLKLLAYERANTSEHLPQFKFASPYRPPERDNKELTPLTKCGGPQVFAVARWRNTPH